MKDVGHCPNSGICVCRASGAKRRSQKCVNEAKRQETSQKGRVKKAAAGIQRLFIMRDTDQPMPSFEEIARAALEADNT
jgi:hypothetical protein